MNVEQRRVEFEQLVQRTHENGLKVIIDFVPNHVARQYHSDVRPELDFGLNDDPTKSFSANNDFYYIPDEELHLPKIEQFPESVDRSKIVPYREKPARATGNDVFHARPSPYDWFETVKLNYGIDFSTTEKHFDPRPPLWDKLLKILCYWIDKGVDGFRCDMVE